MTVDIPTIKPADRKPEDVLPADAYRGKQDIWVYEYDAWNPGEVIGAPNIAVMVRYYTELGQHVDTVMPPRVMPRDAPDAPAPDPPDGPR